MIPEFAIVLRRLLIKVGFATHELENIGAHSLKATCLTWAARFGVAKEDRRILGYHAQPGDKSMDCYARDVVSPSLLKLSEVIAAIRTGTFDPDCTRSGAFVKKDAEVPAVTEVPEITDAVPTTDTDCSTSDAKDSDVDEDLSFEHDVLHNTSTGFAHLVNPTDRDRTLCGKPAPLKLLRAREVPAGARLCRKCF